MPSFGRWVEWLGRLGKLNTNLRLQRLLRRERGSEVNYSAAVQIAHPLFQGSLDSALRSQLSKALAAFPMRPPGLRRNASI